MSIWPVWAAVATVTTATLLATVVLVLAHNRVRWVVGKAAIDVAILLVFVISMRLVGDLTSTFVRAAYGHDANVWMHPSPWVTVVPTVVTIAVLGGCSLRARRVPSGVA